MGRKRIYENDSARKAAFDRKRRVPRETYLANVKQEKADRKIEAWRNKPFIAVDGEGEDDKNGIHHYTMLTASDGAKHHSIEGKSLGTIECFNFLLQLKKENPGGIFVGFSISYDINMMLRDVSIEALTRLWKKGSAIWEGYLITWIPSKMIRISHYPDGYARKKKPRVSMTIYDAFGFFQTSFLRTLELWDIGTPQERHLIYEMKKRRGFFATTSNDEILAYNTLECELLVKLMQKLRQALDTCGLYLQSWHGAGAVGGQFLKINGIEKHIADVPPAVNDAIMHAYFGGRFQTLMLGEHKNAHSHDIRSAYPAAFLELPSMHGEWGATNEYEEDKIYSIYYVKWNVSRSAKNIAPFPHRHKRRISYPISGEGWYWYPEVQAAKKHYDNAVEILQGYVFEPYHNDRPFSFLELAYAQRNAFKAAKNDAQMVLKLGINSVYGKTAQGTIPGKDKPKFQSYFWAGYCTSLTRARIFAMAMRKPESVIAFATDGIFATEKLTTEEEDRNELGLWEHGDNFYLFWAQSGVYFTYDYDKQKSMHAHVGRKTRGLGKSEIRFGKLRKQWRGKKRHAAGDTVSIRRFFGLQYCLHTNRMDLWRRWGVVTKTLELWPRGNHIAIEETKNYIRFGQAGMTGLASEPYVVKGVKKENEDADLLDYYEAISQPEFED